MKKLIILVVCIMFGIAITSSIVTTSLISKSEIEKILLKNAYSKVSLLSQNAQYIVENSAQPIDDLQTLVLTLKQQPDISYAIVINRNVKAIAHSDTEKLNKVYSDDYSVAGAANGKKQHSKWFADVQDVWVYDVMFPIYKNGELYGTFDVGIPITEVDQASKSIIYSQLLATVIVFVLSIITLIYFINRFFAPLAAMNTALHNISKGDGDLTVRLPIKGKNEISDISEAFNTFVSKIQEIITEVSQTSHDLTSTANELKQQSHNALLRGESQNEQTLLIVTSMGQMSSTVNEIAHNASEAAQCADIANQETQTGVNTLASANSSINQLSTVMEQMSDVVTALSNKTQSIGSILEVIKGISEQTNLLALNAAIEAARAGDTGRGFAVVADEVRNLASKTADSADKVQKMINELQDEAKLAVNTMANSSSLTEEGVKATEEAKYRLEEIHKQVSKIVGLNMQVATATEEQSSVTEEINTNMGAVSNSANEGVSASKDLEHSSLRLTKQASTLDKYVGAFKV